MDLNALDAYWMRCMLCVVIFGCTHRVQTVHFINDSATTTTTRPWVSRFDSWGLIVLTGTDIVVFVSVTIVLET